MNPRSQVCPHCKGTISKPRKRNVTLEQSVANHMASCPAVIRINPQKGKS